MRFSRTVIRDAVETSQVAVASRGDGVMRLVKLKADRGGNVVLVAGDGELVTSVSIKSMGTGEEAEVLMQPGRILRILNEMPDPEVEFRLADHLLKVVGSSAKFSLTTESADEYPHSVEFPDQEYLSLPGFMLRRAIHRTVFATDVGSTRYALGGVLFEYRDKTLTLAATDSRRLAVNSVAIVGDSLPSDNWGLDKPVVVPLKVLRLLERNLGDEIVDIVATGNQVVFRTGNLVASSRIVEGRFPRYRDVIPRSSQATIQMPCGTFSHAVRQSQIVTDDENRGVDFVFSGANLTLLSAAGSIGESKIELPIEYSGVEIKVTFDPKYVMDYLKVMAPEDVVELRLTDSETACLFVHDDHQYVVMPLARDQ